MADTTLQPHMDIRDASDRLADQDGGVPTIGDHNPQSPWQGLFRGTGEEGSLVS